MKPSKILSFVGLTFIIGYVVAITIIIATSSCSGDKTLKVDQGSVSPLVFPDNITAITSNSEISNIPDDGQAHIIYRSHTRVIKCKIINLSHSYSSHVVWVETIPDDINKGGEIRELATH